MNSTTNTTSIPSTLRAHSLLHPLKPLLRSKLRWKPLVLVGFLSHPASAAEFGDFYYTDNGTTITIDNYIGLGGAVSLPASIVGKPVTAIAPATNFKVTFKPKAKGPHIAAVRIKSNDKNENPFEIILSGAGAR